MRYRVFDCWINKLITLTLEIVCKILTHQFLSFQADLYGKLIYHCWPRFSGCCSGYQAERQIQTGIGSVTVKVPKIRERDGRLISFRSALVPFVWRTRSLETAIPWLYLKGVSSGEMQDALSILVGPDAEETCWADEHTAGRGKLLHKDQWIYVGRWYPFWFKGWWCQALLPSRHGINERGGKHFLAIEYGVGESTQSWREVLLKLQSRLNLLGFMIF